MFGGTQRRKSFLHLILHGPVSLDGGFLVHPEFAYLGSEVRFQNKGECLALFAAVVYG